MRLGVLLVILGCLGIAFGDVYGQHPKFSNNRLNERSAERNNANRLMNTQNNNRGGYNVGEMSSDPFDENNPEQSVTNTFDTTTERNGQYQLLYEENSWLRIEWTNQHGCGGNEKTDPAKVNCNLVLQYVVETNTPFTAADERSLTQKVVLKDGGNTGTPDAANNYGGIPGTTASNDGNRRGRHESEGFYYDCQKRSRNKGLFHADQKLQGDDARYTRQNPNGARSGLECPEERDYYPYWSPSPWIDIAYFTDDIPNICPLIANSSQNNNNVSYCTGLLKQDKTVPIDFFNCNKTGGKWVQSNKGIPAPECKPAPWGRDNHLGNSRDSIEMAYYDWKVPAYDDLIRYGAKPYSTNPPLIRFVLRLRYNISTDDYDPWHTNSSRDDDPWNGVFSPITQNPTIDVNVMNQGLKLAVNTAQFGRTFQDRSHTFYITKNPTALATSLAGGAKLYNLNVRGKRGNIVQTFPAVEYDFVPAWLQVKVGDWIHIQWTGSNTHNNGEPAGDGQAGDAGEGKTGTDRQNLVLMKSLGENYPIPLDKFPDNAWNTSFDCRRPFDFDNVLPPLTTALILSTSGQIYSTTQTTAIQNFDPLLNDAPASLIQGLICKVKGQPKTIYYMCTRNNNFSNRGQKGQIKVVN